MFIVYLVNSDDKIWGLWYGYCALFRRNNVILPQMINDWLKKGFAVVYIYTSVQHYEAGGKNSQGRKHLGHSFGALLSHVKYWKENQAYGAEEKVQV